MRLSTKPQLPLHSRGSQRDCHVENFSHAGPCYLEEKPRNKELVVTFLVEWCQNNQGKLEFQPLLYTYISILLFLYFFFSCCCYFISVSSPCLTMYPCYRSIRQCFSSSLLIWQPGTGSPLGWVDGFGDYLLRFNQQMLVEPGTYLTSGSAVAACSGNLPFLSGMFCLAPFLSRLTQPSSHPWKRNYSMSKKKVKCIRLDTCLVVLTFICDPSCFCLLRKYTLFLQYRSLPTQYGFFL